MKYSNLRFTYPRKFSLLNWIFFLYPHAVCKSRLHTVNIYGGLRLKNKMNLDTSLQKSPHSNQTVTNIVEKLLNNFRRYCHTIPAPGWYSFSECSLRKKFPHNLVCEWSTIAKNFKKHQKSNNIPRFGSRLILKGLKVLENKLLSLLKRDFVFVKKNPFTKSSQARF